MDYGEYIMMNKVLQVNIGGERPKEKFWIYKTKLV